MALSVAGTAGCSTLGYCTVLLGAALESFRRGDVVLKVIVCSA
jgi:hypothetical protein